MLRIHAARHRRAAAPSGSAVSAERGCLALAELVRPVSGVTEASRPARALHRRDHQLGKVQHECVAFGSAAEVEAAPVGGIVQPFDQLQPHEVVHAARH